MLVNILKKTTQLILLIQLCFLAANANAQKVPYWHERTVNGKLCTFFYDGDGKLLTVVCPETCKLEK